MAVTRQRALDLLPVARRRGRGSKASHTPYAEKKPAGASRRRGGRGRKRGGGKSAGAHHKPALTSHPTTRNAFVATREWLLEQHGPICAYCGEKHKPSTMTLDHVAPRRGQTAYDRRDNLVLACTSCNQKKRDLAPLAFLLGARNRAANLLRYGAHLSSGLIDLARSLVPHEPVPRERGRKHTFEPEDSPYKD
jgi:5-methylcytosine-specific restriction endonuclease McrA